jgi:hypothetical protein
MKPRNLLIAAVLLAALSGLVWWAKKHPPSSDTTASTTTPKVIDVPEAQIQSVDLKKKDAAAPLTITRTGGKWVITSPENYTADQDAVSSLISALSPITADSVVEEKTTDPSKFGLNHPSLTVTVHRKDGKTNELLFGDDVPAGSLVYAEASGSPKTYSLATSVKNSLDKSVNDLRDKRLLTFDTNKLTRLELISGRSDVEFGKSNSNDWQIIKPQPYRADSFQVEELLRKVGEAKMDLTGGADAAKANSGWAAGTPAGTVKVSDSSGTQTLELRKNKDDYYAKSSVVPGIYKVSSDLGKALDKSLDDFRNKKLFDFGFSDPTKIDIQGASGSKTLVRSGTDWKVDGKTMDPGTVQSFIDKLRDLAATRFATGGFGTPVWTITVVSNDGKRTEKAEFAKTAKGSYVGRREGEPALYELDAKPVNDILEAQDAIKPAASTKK